MRVNVRRSRPSTRVVLALLPGLAALLAAWPIRVLSGVRYGVLALRDASPRMRGLLLPVDACPPPERPPG